jgi:hypothetical protein
MANMNSATKDSSIFLDSNVLSSIHFLQPWLFDLVQTFEIFMDLTWSKTKS